MSTSHKVIFFNFPNCSMLLDEIVMNHGIKDPIEFHTIDSSLKVIDLIKETKDAFLIFYNDSPSDYIKAKTMLKQVNQFLDSPIKSIAIVNNTDGTVQKSLRELGVRDIFTHDYHSVDIIEKLEFHLNESIKKNITENKRISKSEADNFLNVVIDKDDYRQEEFSQIVADSIDAKNVNLETGNLAINFQTKDGKDAQCTLENFDENEIEIAFEGAGSFIKDDLIELNIIFQYNRCKVELLIDGLVETSEKTSETGCIVTIKLNNDERVSLQNFMSLYQQRQKSINDFMELAKGF